MRFRINASGDYVVGKGNFEKDDTFTSSVVMALRLQRGSSPLYPGQGSRLHTIKQLTNQSERLAEQYAIEALSGLIRDRKISDVKAAAKQGDGSLVLEVSFRDYRGEERRVVEQIV